MAREVIALLAVLLANPTRAAGHDAELTARQRTVVCANMERLRKALRSSRLTADVVATLSFDTVDSHDLEHAVEFVQDMEASKDLRDGFARVCRTVMLRRSPLGQLKSAPDICFLFASTRYVEWMDAYRLLRREPLGPDLDRAVISLAGNARPELRLVAIRHAITLLFFGRKGEGLIATVRAGLSDPDPNVVVECLFNADDAGDKRVVDRMVACLADDRTLESSVPLFLQGRRTGKVGDVAASRLGWIIYQERCARIPLRPPANGPWHPPRFQVKHVSLMPNEIRAWWKENRAAFGFGTPCPMWKRVFDSVEVLQRGRPVSVRLVTGELLRITLHEYSEGWDDAGHPVTTVRMVVGDADVEWEMDVGNPQHPDWWVPRSSASWATAANRFGTLTCAAAFLPTDKPGQVRTKLVVDVEHE